jgi:signal transduction histidine kinase
MKTSSIRRTLLIGVAVVQLAAAVLATSLVIHHERRSTYATLDASLDERAATLKSVIEPPDAPVETAILHRELLTLPKRDVYLLTQTGGKLIASSGITEFHDTSPAAPRYFTDQMVKGRHYRFLVEHALPIFDEDAVDKAQIPKLNLVYGTPLGGAHEDIQFITWATIGTALILLVLSLAAASWVVRVGMQPVMDLADRAARIDAISWRWDRQENTARTQELEPLSQSLENLVERLRSAFERERQFSADAAHEMKTAVAIVKSTLQLALEREGQAADYRAGVERALEDTERMQDLVNGMLQLAKIEGLPASAPLATESVDVRDQIEDAAQNLQPLLAARGIRLEIHAADPAILAKLPAERLQLILKNLFDNAIQYSPRGSTVHVDASKHNGVCTISIRDEGCGIDPDALPHIFERFYRGDASRSRARGGAGIGLAIVHAAVRSAGGTITATSQAGDGSIFTVTLPAVSAL